MATETLSDLICSSTQREQGSSIASAHHGFDSPLMWIRAPADNQISQYVPSAYPDRSQLWVDTSASSSMTFIGSRTPQSDAQPSRGHFSGSVNPNTGMRSDLNTHLDNQSIELRHPTPRRFRRKPVSILCASVDKANERIDTSSSYQATSKRDHRSALITSLWVYSPPNLGTSSLPAGLFDSHMSHAITASRPEDDPTAYGYGIIRPCHRPSIRGHKRSFSNHVKVVLTPIVYPLKSQREWGGRARTKTVTRSEPERGGIWVEDESDVPTFSATQRYVPDTSGLGVDMGASAVGRVEG